MASDGSLNPYRRPSPYEVLEVKKGPQASANDIGAAYNRARNEARRIKDTKQRAKRMQELEAAKEQLLRPDDRVLFDFFILGGEVFGDLCQSLGEKLADGELWTQKVTGALRATRGFDDLIPEHPQKAAGAFPLLEPLEFFDEPTDPVRLPIAAIDLPEETPQGSPSA